MCPSNIDIEIARQLVQTLIDRGVEKWFVDKDPDYRPQKLINDNDGMKVYNGETKYVIVSYRILNWVVKFNYDLLEEMNYCKVECENYNKAEEAGLAEFFAATYFGGTVGMIDFYLQEAVTTDEEFYDSKLYDYISESGQYDDYINDIDEDDDDEEGIADIKHERISDIAMDLDWEDKVECYFSDCVMIKELIEFLKEVMEANHVAPDLHTGNIGSRNTGETVIFDYSGY